MGLNFSQQISKDVTQGYMDAVNELTSSATASLNTTTLTVNNLNLQLCGSNVCGPGPCNIKNVNINQRAGTSLQLSVGTLQQVVIAVTNKLEDTTTQYVQSRNQSEQAWMSFAFGINSQYQSTISSFAQKISNLITQNVSTNCNSSVISSNTARIVLCGNIDGDANIRQDADVLEAISCISKQIVNNIVSNTELYNGMQYADQQNYSSSSGPLSFLYYIGLFILFIIIVVTLAGTIRYVTREEVKSRMPQKTTT